MKFEAKLIQIISQTPDCSSFRFPKPENFAYKPGQYLVCTLNVGGKPLMHAFSISSSPTENYLEFTKKFTPHEYSVALRALNPGDTVILDAPYGKFTFEGEYPKIALLTGGIGITPFRSIIRYCADKQLPADIVLFYGCRTPADLVFKAEFDQLQKQNPHFRAIYVISAPTADWHGLVGNITEDLVKKELPDYNGRMFYACGPPGMVTAMTNMIRNLGLPDSSLKLENFAGY